MAVCLEHFPNQVEHSAQVAPPPSEFCIQLVRHRDLLTSSLPCPLKTWGGKSICLAEMASSCFGLTSKLLQSTEAAFIPTDKKVSLSSISHIAVRRTSSFQLAWMVTVSSWLRRVHHSATHDFLSDFCSWYVWLTCVCNEPHEGSRPDESHGFCSTSEKSRGEVAHCK